MSSPTRLSQDLFAKPAQHSARVIATALLQNVSTQFDAFVDDPAAGLHDLRVALRRLRTWLRAYRPELDDTVGKKTRRRAGKIARGTNEPRDVEAMREWIESQDDFTSRERAGVRWLIGRLTREQRELEADTHKLLARRVPKMIATLSKELEHYWLHCAIDDAAVPTTMALVARDVLATQAQRIARAIGRIESSDDARKIHRVRIAAKRLRYVLEAIEHASAESLVERLTSLQDTLGASHDMHGIVNRIVRELGEIGAHDARLSALRVVHPDDQSDERPRLATLRPGLVALSTRAHEHERATYESFRATWNDERIASLADDIKALGDELVARSA